MLVKVIHYISFSMGLENRPKVKEARNAAGRLNCSGVVVVEFCFQKYFCLSSVAQLVSNLAVFVCVSVSLSNYVCVCVGVFAYLCLCRCVCVCVVVSDLAAAAVVSLFWASV